MQDQPEQGQSGNPRLNPKCLSRNIDVPATEAQPAFTQLYGDKAVYSVTFVSEEVALKTAEAVQMNPINVYVPDLVTVQRHEQEVADLRRQLSRVTRRGYLEDHGEDFGDDDEPVRAPF